MRKNSYFDLFDGPGWPTSAELGRLLLSLGEDQWSYRGGNDSWGLDAQGLYGTYDLPQRERVEVRLYMTGNPDHGVTLQYDKWDGRVRRKEVYHSKGDLNRLEEFVISLHGTPLSVGLFIPFEVGWKVIKEFIETDGELPSIEWIASRDLPPETFPDP